MLPNSVLWEGIAEIKSNNIWKTWKLVLFPKECRYYDESDDATVKGVVILNNSSNVDSGSLNGILLRNVIHRYNELTSDLSDVELQIEDEYKRVSFTTMVKQLIAVMESQAIPTNETQECTPNPLRSALPRTGGPLSLSTDNSPYRSFSPPEFSLLKPHFSHSPNRNNHAQISPTGASISGSLGSSRNPVPSHMSSMSRQRSNPMDGNVSSLDHNHNMNPSAQQMPSPFPPNDYDSDSRYNDSRHFNADPRLRNAEDPRNVDPRFTDPGYRGSLYTDPRYSAPGGFPVPGYPHPSYPAPTNPNPSYPPPAYPNPNYPNPNYPNPNYPNPNYPNPTYPNPVYPAPVYPIPDYSPQKDNNRPLKTQQYPSPSDASQGSPAYSRVLDNSQSHGTIKPSNDNDPPMPTVSSVLAYILTTCRYIYTLIVSRWKRVKEMNQLKLLNILLVIYLFLSLFFLRTSMVLYFMPSPARFSTLITGIVVPMFALLSLVMLNLRQSVMGLGFITGISAIMFFMIIMSAAYWHEMSTCLWVDIYVEGFLCVNVTYMRFLALVGDLLTCLQGLITFVLYRNRDTLFSEGVPVDILVPFGSSIATLESWMEGERSDR